MTEADTKQEAKKVPAWRRKKVGCCIVLGCIILIIVIAVVISVATKHKKHAVGGEFSKDFTVSWAPNHTRLSNHGRRLELFLDPESGSGFKSNNAFLFGSISMDIKLVPADSAGTVTAYYLFSEAANHDELDFEFLGNSSGEPYILQTNVFANGTGEREQRINLWFDPTTDYHRYGVLWNRRQIVFLVDDLPIRVFTNNEDMGMAYPNQQPMRLYSSLWNGDKWATQGGRVKIDWTHAPFIASYQNYHLDACPATDSLAPCASPVANQWWDQPEYQTLSASKQDKLRWVEQNYMVYNYCSDMKRNNGTVPSECTRNSAGFLGLDSLPH